MLDKSICHLRGVAFILVLMKYCWQTMKTQPDVALHCLPMTLLRIFRQEWVKVNPGQIFANVSELNV